MSLLVTSTPALATEADVHLRGHVMAIPVSSPYVGAGIEVSHEVLRLSLAAEATTLWTMPPKVWATWLRWMPWDNNGNRVGLLAGYTQSHSLFPGPPLMPTPENPNPGLEMPSVLLGFAYEWSFHGWWMRVSPHIGLGYLQTWQWSPPLRALFAGPPLAEVGWQPAKHLEIGLRLSLTPVWVGFHF